MLTFKNFVSTLDEKLAASVVDNSAVGGEVGASVHQDDHSLIKTKQLALKDIVPFEPSSEKIKAPGSAQTFDGLVSAIKSGKRSELPAITVMKHPTQAGKYLVLDGHHRYEAHKKAGSRLVAADIVPAHRVSFEGQNPAFGDR